jgi:PAS domain S-box-containing protein
MADEAVPIADDGDLGGDEAQRISQPRGSDHLATAADFVRHFGHWRDATHDGPVYVTHHGRPTHVLLDYAHFSALTGQGRGSSIAEDPSMLAIADLIDWLTVGFMVCDDRLTIRAINRLSASQLGKSASEMVGQDLWTAVPQLLGTLHQNYILLTARSGEACSADLPSVLRGDSWVRLDVFPLGSGIGIVSRDITDDVTHNRLANVKEAIIEAMNRHGGIGYMRLDTMGLIERISPPLCRLLGLAEDRLAGVSALDILPLRQRAEFREVLAQVLKTGQSARLESAVLSNSGQLVAVEAAITALRGAYGTEGSAVLFTSPEWPRGPAD